MLERLAMPEEAFLRVPLLLEVPVPSQQAQKQEYNNGTSQPTRLRGCRTAGLGGWYIWTQIPPMEAWAGNGDRIALFILVAAVTE